jgi:iron complex transport system substrate-binding protein
MAARAQRVTRSATAVALLAAAALGGASLLAGQERRNGSEPRRIVSLVPATTEMLFAIGAGDRVVGIGSFDRFPADVDGLPRVGGLIDPDTERIVSLRPDLVIVYNTQVELKQRLDRAGIAYYPYEHRTLADVVDTVRAIGVRIGLGPSANAVAAEMERNLAAVRTSVAGRPRPATLLVFGRDPGGPLRNVEASGGYGFLADLLDIAGGENVFRDVERQAVQATTELILARRPDVIVELRYGTAAAVRDFSQEIAPWTALASVPAVRNRRVHALVGDEFVIPGPRVVIAAERLARVLHPAGGR